MATIVNTPAQSSEGGGMGFLLGVVVLILFVLGLLYYGVPMLRNMGQSGIDVNVPDNVNVTVDQQDQPSQ